MEQGPSMAAISTAKDSDRAGRSIAERVSGIDVGLLVLRLVIGFDLFGHGMMKFGWFRGSGLGDSIRAQAETLAFFQYHHHLYFLSWILTLTELSAGIFLMLGLFTPLGAAGLMGISWQFFAGLQWRGGMYGNASAGIGGFEGSIQLLAAATALAFIGPGRLSLDHKLGWRLEGVRWGVVALILGIGIGSLVLTVFGAGFGGDLPTGP